MDEGLPVAYKVLEEGVPVYASGGEQVGTVDHVVAAPEEDIFHGIVVDVPGHGRHVVEAPEIASLHERGVDLEISRDEVLARPGPHGGAAVYGEDPGEMKGWSHWLHFVGLRGDWKRER
jgi:uncharacterized protein YrrD